ncbi:MAG: type II secretion system F family protein [Rhodospirillales bacterium]|nr:type II secretion system F family protein [Alphaproteobacteria bacterium]MCB9986188.1 type II secretion system F family protein [Rhodospirillales bacterium]USO07255.1 MAG: type II secretion system F family protein [Rhodospirillales bacterium]
MPEFDMLSILTFLSALAAGITVIAIALPIVARREKRDKYQDMIARRRRDLFHAAKAEQEKLREKPSAKTPDAKESIAMMFKLRKMVGGMADDLRKKLQQAGYRQPNAPLVFIFIRFAVPLVLAAVSMLLISLSKKEIADSLKLLIPLAALLLGFVLPSVMLKNQAIKRQQEINLTFPDALDMMLVCVQGGISIEQAINRIALEIAEHSPMLAEEMGFLGAELGLLNDRRGAFQDFARRVGSGAARSFATSMIQAEQYGTSISSALRVMADESRDIRMAEAERKAASLPPKLTVPMIVFFLPALFVVILGPAGIQAVTAAHGG